MFQRLKHPGAGRFGVGVCVGLVAGLLVGVGMLVGSLTATRQAPATWSFPETQLRASATHSSESFAMATGMIADGVEGVFFLDYLTGELQGYVLNGRTGKLGAGFKRNVADDLGVQKDKRPNFLMVTGQAAMRTTGSVGGRRPADCVVYVCDASTGRFGVYGVPWNSQTAAVGGVQGDTFYPLGAGKVRDLPAGD